MTLATFLSLILVALLQGSQPQAPSVIPAPQGTHTENGLAGFAKILCSGVFILPFFLFSATSGQLADKFEKSRLIRITKIMEIGVMGVGAAAFELESLALMLGALFLMGTQSAIFGPSIASSSARSVSAAARSTANSTASMPDSCASSSPVVPR